MRRKRLWLGLGAIAGAVLVAVSLAALRGAPESTSVAETTAPAALEFLSRDLYTVRQEALERTLAVTGTLAPLVEADVKARVAGQLLEVAAREGEPVRAGQLLARIDATEQGARVAARNADLQAARSQLALAQKTLEQQRALLGKGYISRNAFQNAESGFEVARARVGTARAELAVAQEALQNAALRAPFSGLVAARLAEPGERVAVDATVLRIVDLSRLTFQAPVPAESIGGVRVGQPVRFGVQGLEGREFTGKVERINPTTTEGSRSVPVHVGIDNPEGLLRGGLFASGALVLERIEDALPIPATAVREEGGRAYVYKIEDEVVRRQAVELGVASRSGLVEVRSGLQPGDVVVRTNLGQLREGARVRLGEIPVQAYR